MTHRLAALLALALLASGCGKYLPEGRARLDISPSGLVGNSHCWATLEFKDPPAGTNPADVRLRLEGAVLLGVQEFTWAQLAPLAQKRRATGVGRDPAPEIRSAATPPLRVSFDVDLVMPLQPRVSSDADFLVNAKLYWGGRLQATDSASVRFLYKAE